MSQAQFPTYKWAAPGDVNAFFGLMLDNIADLLLMVGLMVGVFGFPADFALRYMVPGTAIGVFVGDMLFFSMALKTARRSGNTTLTAMPLGLDTPSTFGMVFFVLGPAFLVARKSGLSEHDAAMLTWQIGICSIVISGLFKLACSFGSNWIRKVIPRAGLLGSLAAVAMVLISFLPLLETVAMPIVGLVALSIILTTLVARIRLPWNMPGALGALLIASAIYYFMKFTNLLPGAEAIPESIEPGIYGWFKAHFLDQGSIDPIKALLPYEWVAVFRFQWLTALGQSVNYLPVVIPFALGTVVGGIDCTESAAAAGDEFDTGEVIRVEAFATLMAGLCGGVIQTTPYIGHPAYKAMGGRAGYTLATAVFVAAAGLLGFFGFLYILIPKPTVFPILVFIGLEITAQSFFATPRRHYPAVVFACVPALAALAAIIAGKFAPYIEKMPPHVAHELATITVLQNGFIVTSLLWASLLAALIDQRLKLAAGFAAIAGACSLFGIIHSPLPNGAMFLPFLYEGNPLTPEHLDTCVRFTLGYLISAALLLGYSFFYRPVPVEEE